MREANNKKWYEYFAVAGTLLVTFFVCNLQMKNGAFLDSFHFGECFTSLTSILHGGAGDNFLTIHGALDYIPGFVSVLLLGEHKHFFPTWFFYQVLGFFAALMFVVLIGRLVRGRSHALSMLVGVSVLAPSLVGFREVLLIPAIYLYFAIQEKKASSGRVFLEFLFGVLVALNVFWSFDRGIAGAFALGVGCLIYAYRQRLYIIAFVSFFATVLLLGFISPVFSPSAYIENVIFLINTSANWRYGWNGVTISMVAFLGFVNATAVWMLWSALVKSKTLSVHLANASFLTLLAFLMFKIGSNRPDAVHVLMGLWVPLLIGFYWRSVNTESEPDFCTKAAFVIITFGFLAANRLNPSFAFLAAFFILAAWSVFLSFFHITDVTRKTLIGLILLCVPFLIASRDISLGAVRENYKWINYFGSLPYNSGIVPGGVHWTSREIVNSGAQCVFDLSNNGVINALTALPTCTRFSYPVYADSRYESEIVNALRDKQPNAIVYSTTGWSYKINRKPMNIRFPVLDEFIMRNYAQEKCSLDYCVRYLRAQP